MSYNYRFTLPKYRILRRYKRVILALSLLLLIIIGLYLTFLWYIHQGEDMHHPQTDLKTQDFNPMRSFETDYFSFDTDKTWKFVKAESGPGKYVYRSSRKNIVMRDLTVYVNSLPSNLLLTYVLSVQEDNDRFLAGDISPHCSEFAKHKNASGNNPIDITVSSVRIKCQVDGTSFTAGTGKKGGSYDTKLRGPHSGSNQFYLLYHDLEFTPQPDQFVSIVRSFHAK